MDENEIRRLVEMIKEGVQALFEMLYQMSSRERCGRNYENRIRCMEGKACDRRCCCGSCRSRGIFYHMK